MLSALGEIRIDECKEREDALEKARRKEYSGAVLLCLRGFLHAFHLVEMTVLFYHCNFTFGETSLVIDKLHFPQENFTCNANFTRASGFHCVALLRLRGFLHAFHLVEMTTKKRVPSSRAKSCHSEGLNNPKNLLGRTPHTRTA